MENQNKKQNFFWKFYFVLGGMMSLLCWNSVLNLTSFFINSINPAIYTNLGFGFCLGGLISFVISPLIFLKFKTRQTIYTSLIMSLVTYILIIVFCVSDIQQTGKIYLVTIITFLNGFFSSTLQSKLAGIAASVSGKEIGLFNFGTGLIGALSNVIIYIIQLLFPESDTNRTSQLNKQAYLYVFITCLFFILTFISEIIFEKQYSDQIHFKEEREIETILSEKLLLEDTDQSMSEIKIIVTIFDLMVGIFYQYAIVITIVGCFLIESQQAYDQVQNKGKGNGFTIPFYIFYYNLFDTIGKYLPHQIYFKSTRLLHLCTMIGIIFWIYFAYILTFDNISSFMTAPYMRVVILCIVGLLNGYYTNNFMTQGANRFEKPLEKGKAGYFSVLFLLAGITMGTLMNYLLKS